MKSSGPRTMCVVPSRYGAFSRNWTSPCGVSVNRTAAIAGRLTYRQSRSSFSRASASMPIPACSEKPAYSATSLRPSLSSRCAPSARCAVQRRRASVARSLGSVPAPNQPVAARFLLAPASPLPRRRRCYGTWSITLRSTARRREREHEEIVARTRTKLRRERVQPGNSQRRPRADGDVLHAVNRKADRVTGDRRAEIDPPEHGARVLIERANPAVHVDAEDEPAGRREQRQHAGALIERPERLAGFDRDRVDAADAARAGRDRSLAPQAVERVRARPAQRRRNRHAGVLQRKVHDVVACAQGAGRPVLAARRGRADETLL